MARIAFLIPTLSGGGAERVALSLITHFVGQGHAVDLLIMRGDGELLPLLPPEARVIVAGGRRLRHLLGPLVRYLTSQKPDSVHAMMWPLTSIAVVARMLSGSKARLVLSDHSMMSRHYRSYRGLRRFLLRHSIRWLYPRADARVIVSAMAADDLARFTGLRREALIVINNPVEPPQAGRGTSQAVERLWPGAGRRIITVGSLKPEKNQFLLLIAFSILRQTHDVELLIVGDGELRPALEAHAKALGIADHVALPGFAIDPSAYYASAELFVLSSDNEGYPLVLVEAMFAGLRIVSTDCPSGPREILGGGDFGELVRPRREQALADAMARALAAPHDPERIKRRAHELSEHSFVDYEDVMLGERSTQRSG